MSELDEKTDLIAEAITEAFGERCPDFAEGCYCCDAWKQYDALRASPAPTVSGDDECTDCGGTGLTYQTERRCSCQPAPTRDDVLEEAAQLADRLGSPPASVGIVYTVSASEVATAIRSLKGGKA